MKKVYSFSLFIILNSLMVNAQKINTDFLPKLMAAKPEQFKDLMDNAGRYRLQILYTQIDRDKKIVPNSLLTGIGLIIPNIFILPVRSSFPPVLWLWKRLII